MAITLDSVQVDSPISLAFVQGQDLTINLSVTDTLDVASDLTGMVVASSIRKEYNQPVLASFTVDDSDIANGNIKLVLPAATSSAFIPRSGSRVTSYVFDVKFTYQNGDVDYPFFGYLKMTRAVTV